MGGGRKWTEKNSRREDWVRRRCGKGKGVEEVVKFGKKKVGVSGNIKRYEGGDGG